jgi:hypothetical protein
MLASVVGVAACSSSSSAPGASSAASKPQSSASVPARNLKPQLLTVAELPTGWAVDNSSDSSDSGAPPCLKDLKATFNTSDRAKVDFVKGTDLPQFEQSLGYFGTIAAALAKYQAGAAILNNCKDVSFTSDGHKFTGSIGALSFPKVGQQSSAWQLVISTQGVTVGLDAVLVQVGPELTMLIYGDLGGPDLDEATSLARKAVAKMPAT